MVLTQPSHGTLSGTAPNLTYTPYANYNGADSFTFEVNDGAANSTPATVSITVTAVNDPPVATDDAATTYEAVPVTINVLGNDTDADGDSLFVASITQPANGTAVNNTTNIAYTPNPSFSGTDSFTYAASDGKGGTAWATVRVTVSGPPPPKVLFSDSFESGNFTAGGWTISSASVKKAGAYSGTYYAQTKKSGWIRKPVSTVGYSGIHVKYARSTQALDAGEYLYVEWSTNGTKWYAVESTRDTAWVYKDLVCPTGADNNAGFMIRFRTNANRTDEFGNVDAVVITGIPLP